MSKNFSFTSLIRDRKVLKEQAKQLDNVVYLNKNSDDSEEPEKVLYKKRKYLIWTSKEVKFIEKRVLDAKKKNIGVELSEMLERFYYRTPKGIRCKTREIMHKNQCNTYTFIKSSYRKKQKENTKNGKH